MAIIEVINNDRSNRLLVDYLSNFKYQNFKKIVSIRSLSKQPFDKSDDRLITSITV